MMFSDTLQKLMGRQSLSRYEAQQSMGQLMRGEVSAVQIAAYLTALRVKGETVDEISGFVDAMREAAVPVKTSKRPLIDTCGTGGDGCGTFNVSTAAAFVVAGAGFTVAKHGNRSVSSKCGSADVLEALGIPMHTDPRQAEASLEQFGLTFLFAPAFHPAMKHAMPVRRELAARTVFNLLGPLANPAKPSVQLVGVYDPRWLEPVAEVLSRLGCEEAVIVHGQGHDEITPGGPTQVAELHDGRVALTTYKPEDFGLKTEPEPRMAGGVEHCAKVLRQVLEGHHGFYRDTVCINAAAAIRAALRSKAGGRQDITLQEACRLSQESIDKGAALGKFEELRTHG